MNAPLRPVAPVDAPTFALRVAREVARSIMQQARAAKANNRPTVVAFYVQQARAAMHEGKRGRFGTLAQFIAGC